MNPPSPTINFQTSRPLVAPTPMPVMPSNTANAAQMAASRVIPVVPTPPPDMSFAPPAPPQILQYLSITISGGKQQRIELPGNYLYFDSVTQDSGLQYSGGVDLTTDQSQLIVPLTDVRIGYRYATPFKWINLNNRNLTINVTINFWIGVGDVIDNRDLISQPTGISNFCSGTVARPNNVIAYAANQAVNSNPGAITAADFITGSVNAGTMLMITGARMSKNSATTANASFRCYIQSSGVGTPSGVNDQAAWPFLFANYGAAGGVTLQKQFIDFPTFVTGGAGSNAAVCEIMGLAIPIKLGSTLSKFFFQLTAQAAYVPVANELFALEFWVTDVGLPI